MPSKNSGRKKGIGIFFLSMFVSLIVLGGIFTLYFLYTRTEKTQQGQEDIPYEISYAPKPSENMKILIIGCEKIHLPPKFFLLISYKATQGEISATVIPPNAVVTVGVREDTVMGHYDYEGIRGGVNAVKSLLVCEIDRYARLDRTGLANLVDFLGGMDYDLQQQATYTGDGYTETFVRGKQLLDGRRTTALLFQTKKGQINTDLQQELTNEFLTQRFRQSLDDKLPNFISAFFYNAETNMNQYDFVIRQKGLSMYLRQDKLKIHSMPLTGEYVQSDNTFIADTHSIETIMNYLEKTDEE